MKIFGIGFHKTGTTTLGYCLEILGYTVIGAKVHLAKQIENEDFDEFWELTKRFDAFQDNPWAIFFEKLDKAYPGSKFILTIREEERWLKSVKKYFGKKPSAMRELIYGEPFPVGNEELYLSKYRRHNEKVKAYFKDRKEDLLIVNWESGDGWKELCEFLNLEIPKEEFPHFKRNKTPRGNAFKEIKYWIKHRLKLY